MRQPLPSLAKTLVENTRPKTAVRKPIVGNSAYINQLKFTAPVMTNPGSPRRTPTPPDPVIISNFILAENGAALLTEDINELVTE